jgi:hypothetical protein
MIPGNRPEDIAEEEFWQTVFEKLEDKLNWDKMDKMSARMENWDDITQAFIQIVRDLSYERGFNEGRQEEQMAQAMKEEKEYEKRQTSPAPPMLDND